MRRPLISGLLALAVASCSLDERPVGLLAPGEPGDGGPDQPEAGLGGASGAGGAAEAPCSGCLIDGACAPTGARHPSNPCQICDPTRSAVNYSPNTAASCGSPESECSAQDTCSEQGQCLRNDASDGTSCGAQGSGRVCLAGECSDFSHAESPDALCAERSAATPLCDLQQGSCVACLATTCTGATPVCERASGCRACTEHSDCPNSACHLSGVNQGRCFASGEVVQVSSVEALRAQIGVLVPSAPRVLRLAATTFSFTELLDIGEAGTELAILGQAGTVLSGGPTNGAPPLISLAFDSTLYLANLTIADGPVNAINTSSGTILWLDDVVIRDYGNTGVSGVAEGHIRRSQIRATNLAVLWQGGSLFMENTSLGPGAGVGLQTSGAPIIDVRYVTIAGNTSNLVCDASPGPSGAIRNSILAGTTAPTISGVACELLGFSGNAVDQSGFGASIAHFDASWFSDALNGDFHLTAAGAAVVGSAAELATDDPKRDIDGALRPASGAPGVDQP